jgi:hypothetical protein
MPSFLMSSTTRQSLTAFGCARRSATGDCSLGTASPMLSCICCVHTHLTACQTCCLSAGLGVVAVTQRLVHRHRALPTTCDLWHYTAVELMLCMHACLLLLLLLLSHALPKGTSTWT